MEKILVITLETLHTSSLSLANNIEILIELI